MREIDSKRLRKYRISRVNQEMEHDELDAIITTTMENVKYLGGIRIYLTPSYAVNSYISVYEKDRDPIVQGPVMEGSSMGLAPEVKGWTGYPMVPIPAISSSWAKMVATILKDLHLRSGARVGIDDMSFISRDELVKEIGTAIDFVPAFDTMLRARAIKNEDEIGLLIGAAKIVDAGAKAGLDSIKTGASERDVVAKMAAKMYEMGSEGEPWAASLASGDRSLSSLFPTDKVMREGELAVFDIGSLWHGYMGDIARTGAAGKPNRECREIYTAAYNALMAGIGAVRPGVLSSEIDRRIRETLIDAECEVSPLSTGHGIGVGAPEIPWITPKQEGIIDYELKEGMVLALEPRTSKYNLTAAGCEDMVLVTSGGHEVLTNCQRQEELLIK
jgi:Xaa-Pro aminopeptidase